MDKKAQHQKYKNMMASNMSTGSPYSQKMEKRRQTQGEKYIRNYKKEYGKKKQKAEQAMAARWFEI